MNVLFIKFCYILFLTYLKKKTCFYAVLKFLGKDNSFLVNNLKIILKQNENQIKKY